MTPTQHARYRHCLRISKGNHKYALRMVQGNYFAPAPGTLSDREFFAGRGTLADQFQGDEQTLKLLVAEAQRRGYTPGPNDVYTPTLARDFGDPLAFVPPTGGRGHIKKVCEMRGDECQGLVNVKSREMVGPSKQDDGPPLAEDIVTEGVAAEIRQNPDLVTRKAEVREAFIERHAPKP